MRALDKNWARVEKDFGLNEVKKPSKKKKNNADAKWAAELEGLKVARRKYIDELCTNEAASPQPQYVPFTLDRAGDDDDDDVVPEMPDGWTSQSLGFSASNNATSMKGYTAGSKQEAITQLTASIGMGHTGYNSVKKGITCISESISMALALQSDDHKDKCVAGPVSYDLERPGDAEGRLGHG